MKPKPPLIPHATKPRAGVYIDGANLYYSQRKSMWKLDLVKLRRFVLENHKHILFLGFHKTMAWELKQGKYFYLDFIKTHIIQGEKATPRTKPGRLLVSLLYQKPPRKST